MNCGESARSVIGDHRLAGVPETDVCLDGGHALAAVDAHPTLQLRRAVECLQGEGVVSGGRRCQSSATPCAIALPAIRRVSPAETHSYRRSAVAVDPLTEGVEVDCTRLLGDVL